MVQNTHELIIQYAYSFALVSIMYMYILRLRRFYSAAFAIVCLPPS